MKVIGIDPGPIPGIVALLVDRAHIVEVQVAQCTPALALDVVKVLLDDGGRAVIATETFVVGHRAARSSTANAGTITRELIGQLHDLAAGPARAFIGRPAGQVKPWATDERLDAAGLLDLAKGMRHARDAARHALYAAVKNCGLPDPLSTRARRP